LLAGYLDKVCGKKINSVIIQDNILVILNGVEELSVVTNEGT
jgi:hypothetical protein